MNHHLTVIEAGKPGRAYLADLWKFRQLMFFLAWRDVKVRYKQTVIGVLWSILRPLLTMLAMWFIGYIFNAPVPGQTPRIIVACAATLPWTFFASTFSESASSLISNSNLVTKVYFPRIILPLSTVLVCLVDFLISLGILIGLMVIYGFTPSWTIALLPFFTLLAMFAALGAGVFIAALNVKYRDFRYIVPFIVQFGLYITPVAFSTNDVMQMTTLPGWAKFLYSCNPMVAVIDGFRWCIIGHAAYQPSISLIISLSTIPVLVFLGYWYFRRTERAFADFI